MDKFISAFPAGKSEELRIHIRQLRGHAVVDMRVWSSLKPDGEKIPTGKGVTVPASRLEDLKQAVLAAEVSLKETCLPS